jgi:hypothetical protein
VERTVSALVLRATATAMLLAFAGACSPTGIEPAASAPGPRGEVFHEAAAESGLRFRHFNGMSGEHYLPEIMGAGGALFDYDNDGDLDVYLVQGGPLDPAGSEDGSGDRLFRNDLHDGRAAFTDVTVDSGIIGLGYGMGVATGDYDNDGWIDLYVTNFGPNRLLRNRGDGTFEDVTEQTGTDDPRWSVPAAFVDFDRDGRLDLFVGNYVEFRFAVNRVCRSASGQSDYCSPTIYSALPDRLFRNRGDGTFEDVTGAAGLRRAHGNALGVIPIDADLDGWLDLFVANDGTPNQLWMNRAGAAFDDEALLRGCAINMEGRSEASMGVDAADFDGDGDEDLFMTHLRHETNTLYLNRGDGWFDDHSLVSDLGAPSRRFTGFGTGWFDYDLDGRLDLLVVNGAVQALEDLLRAEDPYPLHQRDQLFRNLGEGRFEQTSESAGEYFEISEVGRGAAFGDVDNDGDVDVLITSNNGPVRLLINVAPRTGQWVGLRLVGSPGPRDMLGARVGLVRVGHEPVYRRVRTAGSYASARDPRVLFALGDRDRIERISVEWPSGDQEVFDPVEIDGYSTLRQGDGRP